MKSNNFKAGWGVVRPSDTGESRVRLNFGLGSAILRFNEWTVPGLGSASFVRQLSWACMGLLLWPRVERRTTAAKVAESLEACASWMAIKTGENVDHRVLGKRKLAGRTELSFDDVATRGAYVTVTFRQGTTRALPGLGLSDSRTLRFRNLELNQEGLNLAAAALRPAVAEKLLHWVDGKEPMKRVDNDVKNALLAGRASRDEKKLVRKGLLANPRRANLALLVQKHPLASLAGGSGRKDFLRGVNDPAHRARIDAAFAFNDMRQAAFFAAQTTASVVDRQGASMPAGALAANHQVQSAFRDLAKAAKTLSRLLPRDAPQDARDFCAEQLNPGTLEHRVLLLAGRAPVVFSMLGKDVNITADAQRLAADEPDEAGELAEAGALASVPLPLRTLSRMLTDIASKSDHGG